MEHVMLVVDLYSQIRHSHTYTHQQTDTASEEVEEARTDRAGSYWMGGA